LTTSAEQGFRLAPEWAPHEATLLAWPFNVDDWPGKFEPIPWVFAEMVRHIACGEAVFLAVSDAAHEAQAREVLGLAGVNTAPVKFVQLPLDRGWMRDISPAYVVNDSGERRAVHFGFTGWAKYDNHTLDAAWPDHISKVTSTPIVKAMHGDRHVVLEGGAIDSNGRGTLITTEECLLHPDVQVRNPGFTREVYESVFRDSLGITHTLWLGDGIAGDDTHGHVDDLCRFVNETTLVLCQEPNGADANHRPLAVNWERLQNARLEDGSRPEVIALPMPAPVCFDGMRLPASYANFYIANERVLVPTFNDPNDRIALGILAELFPTRTVVGIHALDLVWGLGTIHCLTHEMVAG
jgi:agmatine deiminase